MTDIQIPTVEPWGDELSQEFERQFGKIKRTTTLIDHMGEKLEVPEGNASFYVALGLSVRFPEQGEL